MPGRDRSWRTWRSSWTSRGRRPGSRSARPARPTRGESRRTRRGWPWPPSLLLQGGELVDDRARRRVGLQIVAPRGLADSEDLADRANRLGGLRRLAVPLGVVLHERDPLALDGVGHDERRRPPGRLGRIERLPDLVRVVAVDLEDGPPERLPLRDDGLEVHDLRHEIVELDLVVVEDDAEVVERVGGPAELRRRHRRLPHLPLLDLAVAEDAVDARRSGAELEPERHAERDRQALAERARRRLDAGQGGPVGMALEPRAELAERDELGFVEVARPRHDRVERGDGVALGEDDAVPIGPVGALRVVAQPTEVERREDIDHRERAARMPRACVGEHADDLHPALAGDGDDTRVRHQSSSSVEAAISSTRTPCTAISGAYTTSSAAQTIVDRTSLVTPTMFSRIVPMFSLIRIAFARIGAARRPARMI